MKAILAYQEGISANNLEGEQAFEELYARLARWCHEIDALHQAGRWHEAEDVIEKATNLLSLMDELIDVGQHYEIASRVLTLHRFAIRTLVKARTERSSAPASGLEQVFVDLAETFAAMSSPAPQE